MKPTERVVASNEEDNAKVFLLHALHNSACPDCAMDSHGALRKYEEGIDELHTTEAVLAHVIGPDLIDCLINCAQSYCPICTDKARGALRDMGEWNEGDR